MLHYRSGRIFTADPLQPWAQSLIEHNGVLRFVGNDADADSISGSAEIIDLDGALVLPGFIDAHTHLIHMGQALTDADLFTARDTNNIQSCLRDYAAANPSKPRLLGRRWLISPHNGDYRVHSSVLDAIVPDRPVYIFSNDMHSAWLNTAALMELGIDHTTPDPVGGTIARDAHTGAATGMLYENAVLNYVFNFLSSCETDNDREIALKAACEAYMAVGVTGAIDMAIDSDSLAALEHAEANDQLGIRIAGYWLVIPTGDAKLDLEQVATAVGHAHRLSNNRRLCIVGIKIIVDGVIDSCTAAMKAPYSNGSHPDPIWPLSALEPVVVAADAANLQIAIHAIGDEASDIAISAIEKAIAVNTPRERRHRLEHLEVVTKENITRIAQLGLIASMQPVHADPAIQEGWRVALGDFRVERGYPWPEVTAAGAVLAFGTDAPTASHHTLHNMFVATTRKSAIEPTLFANFPEYVVPLSKALVHGTYDAAYSCYWENITGKLSAGLAADFVILTDNPFILGNDSLLTTEVAATVIGGRIRYKR